MTALRGRCRWCERTVALTGRGVLRKHRPDTTAGSRRVTCLGSGQEPAA